MYLVPAEKQGIAWDSLRETIQNDILKEYIAQAENTSSINPISSL
jgi:methylmalonyl-CoA mutase N-terminal domain/subunit